MTPLLIERAMTIRQNIFFSYEMDGNNTWEKYYLLREIVTIYKKAKPLLLETEMATCKKPYSAL